jgi:hypothetical protein
VSDGSSTATTSATRPGFATRWSCATPSATAPPAQPCSVIGRRRSDGFIFSRSATWASTLGIMKPVHEVETKRSTSRACSPAARSACSVTAVASSIDFSM